MAMYPVLYTKIQMRKALEAAGIAGKVEVTGTGRNMEVEIAEDAAYDIFVEKIAAWSGFTTGYGARILRPYYQDMGDWNDPTSRHHY